MTIAAILNRKGRMVVRVPPDATVGEVVARLAEHQIGVVLVLEAGAPASGAHASQMLGIISERDIVRALRTVQATGDLLDLAASQVMTEARHTIALSGSLAEAAALMTDRRVRHLPVLENDRLVGLVSIGDVVKARLEQQEGEMDSLRAYVGGAH